MSCTPAQPQRTRCLQSGLETDRAYFYDWSDSAAYLLTNNGGTESCYHLDYKGKMTPTNHRPKTEPQEENAEPSTKPVIVADYQNYSIEITCTVPKEPGDSDCGYRYIAGYVLKEKATGKSYAPVLATTGIITSKTTVVPFCRFCAKLTNNACAAMIKLVI